jgi:hypothetical protein
VLTSRVAGRRTWHPLARSLKRRDPWNVYFEETNAALQGHELCDCYRKEPFLFENRFLRIGPAALSFMTQLVSNSTPMKGHVLPAEHKTMRERLRCSPGQCSGGALWEVSLVHGAH